jgi:hypothetical protein
MSKFISKFFGKIAAEPYPNQTFCVQKQAERPSRSVERFYEKLTVSKFYVGTIKRPYFQIKIQITY